MNTPNPIPSGSPAGTSAPTNPAMPTLGSILGAVVGTTIITKTGQMSDPVTSGAILSATGAFFTALFHWLGTKIGVNLG